MLCVIVLLILLHIHTYREREREIQIMVELSLSNALLDGIILTHTIHPDEEDDELGEPKYSVNLLKIKVLAVCIPQKPVAREVSNVDSRRNVLHR